MPEVSQFDKLKQKPLVLFSPLDWGWGHTTRCIPLIESLIQLNCSVLIACNQWQADLLRPLFPDCNFIDLPGYNIKYGRSGTLTRISLVLQIPHIFKNIRKEREWLRLLLTSTPIQGIISDNRYGLYDHKIPAVLITHQLHIQSGSGRLVDRLLQKKLYGLIRRFSQCWVPDTATKPGAAGKLSHPAYLPLSPTHYLGCISRLEPCTEPDGSIILILLSGPEPQRSILEKLMVHQLIGIPEPVVLVRGVTSGTGLIGLPANVTVINSCSTEMLHTLFCNARIVIARSGYTTVMDLLKLKKKSILIPTPGQPEQEYLGKHLMSQQWMLTVQQKNFSLQQALQLAETFPYKVVNWEMEQYKEVVKKWVWSLT